jgi:hypothetical protein
LIETVGATSGRPPFNPKKRANKVRPYNKKGHRKGILFKLFYSIKLDNGRHIVASEQVQVQSRLHKNLAATPISFCSIQGAKGFV